MPVPETFSQPQLVWRLPFSKQVLHLWSTMHQHLHMPAPPLQRGHSSTALTACFAGPLFNMLISMAAGFGSYFAKEGITRYACPDVMAHLGLFFVCTGQVG